MPEDAAEVSKNCHIYLICERPALSFEKESFSYKEGRLTGNLIHRIEGVEHKTPFEQEFPLLDDAVDLEVYSPQSPLGAAILGAAPGDTVTYAAPNGSPIIVTIVEVKAF